MENLENKSEVIDKYKTYVQGTIGELENCYRIVLYKSDYSNKASLDRLSNGSIDVTNIKNSITLDKTNNYFSYNKINLPNGFNTIIYLNQFGNPIGYSEFINTQGIIPEKIKIFLSFKVSANLEDPLDINIVYNLSEISKSTLNNKTKKLFSDKLYGFTSAQKIIKELNNSTDIYPRYTRQVSELLKQPYENIFLDFGICNSLGIYRLNLVREMTIAEDLKNHQLGYYRGEIVLYSWKKDEISGIFKYTIHSMSRKNKFGNPICYTNTTEGTKDIKPYPNNSYTIKDIRYFSGKYISTVLAKNSFSGGEEIYSIYNLETEDWVSLELPNHVMDLWGVDSRIIELPKAKQLSISSITSFCPDILNTYLDIKNYSYSIDLIKKVGEWFVLKQVRYPYTFRIYTNMTKTIILSDTDGYLDQEPILINNNILALRTIDTYRNNKYDFYTYFVGKGLYYSEKALLVMNLLDGGLTKSLKPVPDNPGVLYFPHTNPELSNLKNFGTNLLTDVVGENSDFLNSYLFGFRRNTCPDDLKVPELIGSINGLVYYKTKNNKIKLL